MTRRRTEDRAPRNRRAARLVLALGIVLGLGYLVSKSLVVPEDLATDFEIYRAAAADLWAGEAIFGRSPVDVPGLTYRYPPVVLAWFSLYLLVATPVGYLLHVVGILAASAVLGLAIATEVARRGVDVGAVDRGLIVGFVAVSPYAAPSLFFGNVNHHVALAVGLGLLWLSRGAPLRSGAGLGIGALLKVFPAGVGVWLLWRRAWRATAAATVTGVAGLVAGIALFGTGRTRAFVQEALLPRLAPETAAAIRPSSVYVTLRRPLSVPVPDASAATLTILSVGVLAPVVGYLYRRSAGPTGRSLALFATLAALLLVLPSYSNYFTILFVPLVGLLYLFDGPGRTTFLLGASLSLLTLKLEGTTRLVGLLPLARGGEQVLSAGARTVYTVGTPVLWGTLLMLVACVVNVRAGSDTPAGDSSRTRAKDGW